MGTVVGSDKRRAFAVRCASSSDAVRLIGPICYLAKSSNHRGYYLPRPASRSLGHGYQASHAVACSMRISPSVAPSWRTLLMG